MLEELCSIVENKSIELNWIEYKVGAMAALDKGWF